METLETAPSEYELIITPLLLQLDIFVFFISNLDCWFFSWFSSSWFIRLHLSFLIAWNDILAINAICMVVSLHWKIWNGRHFSNLENQSSEIFAQCIFIVKISRTSLYKIAWQKETEKNFFNAYFNFSSLDKKNQKYQGARGMVS